jgi:hypothetical protein
MTDITKEAIPPARTLLSQDSMQVFYRLLAALLICIALALLSESFLSLGNILNVLRQASLTFFIASGHRFAHSGYRHRAGRRRYRRPAQRRDGDGAADSLVYRDLWHALGAEWTDLLVHGR